MKNANSLNCGPVNLLGLSKREYFKRTILQGLLARVPHEWDEYKITQDSLLFDDDILKQMESAE